jgi:hypothetical protein
VAVAHERHRRLLLLHFPSNPSPIDRLPAARSAPNPSRCRAHYESNRSKIIGEFAVADRRGGGWYDLG